MKIKKAIIAAAGKGTRFLPVSKAYPKELTAVLDKPIIQIHIEELINCGIKEICIVHRPKENQIKKYFSFDKKLHQYLKESNRLDLIKSLGEINKKTKLTFIKQDDKFPYGNASPILAAKKFIGKEDFIYFFGDDLTIETKPGTFLKEMLDIFEKENTDGILTTTKVNKKEIYKYGTIVFKESYKKFKIVEKILEKNENTSVNSNYIQLYKFIFKNKVLDYLSTQKTSKNNELWLSDTNNTIAKNGKLIAVPLNENILWSPAGDPINWLKTNLIFAINSPKYKREIKSFFKKINKYEIYR